MIKIPAKLNVLYVDDAIVVVDKPGGLLAVPGRGPEKIDSVSTRLKKMFRQMIEQPAVHRLDMFTSGVMVYAKTGQSHRNLSNQFARREVKKIYEAVVEGVLSDPGGEIRLSFRLNPQNRPLQIYDPVNGKSAITVWQKIAANHRTTRVRFFPVTGRTHQLRVHSAHPLGLAAPIVGDSLYGRGCEGDRMLLHATSLCFTHPVTGKTLTYRSTPPF
ncbi:RluA family pseudouridine synthase [Desulforhopalus singaporensis]|uniref:tRNA pseudouridine32 synthase / 23S rRNA pseudouridine746 synthase n=1 Tax=Desulforhopalus singaporensis TaxID=91360 RepID=A0A1H0UH84_9BACT|nr:RluA family pseudouridine synthase [Desulforhopalus singaporensis]SDP65493.1 tRNA pseudouridine32 synthase / 23S rRNA pseudouridine746 synthase [Desulforhopalus singaporensis]